MYSIQLLSNGDVIEVTRATSADRATTYATYNNTFRPEVLNKDIDRIWLKIQELGVADVLLKIYTDKLHLEQKNYIDSQDQIIRQIINDLKVYLDQQDINLDRKIIDQKGILENLINKQGTSLQQLDNYYNYLMQKIANVATEKGWDSSFIAYKDTTQYALNEKQEKINAQWIDIAPYLLDEATLDTNKIKELIVIAKAQSKGIRCSPRNVVSINDDIDFTGVNYIEFDSNITLTAGKTITWGGTAISGANATIRFMNITDGTSGTPSAPMFRIFGAKQAEIRIGSCNYVQLYADAATSIRNSVAYNQIQLTGIVRLFEITDSGVAGGWINENTIKGGRLVKVRIVGKGYAHNHNHFDRNCIEGTSAELYFERAWENRFTNQRFEGVNPGCINFGEETFCNHVVGSWVGTGSLRSYFHSTRKGVDLGRGNTVTTDKIHTYEQVKLWSYSENTPIYGTALENTVADSNIGIAHSTRLKASPSIKPYGALFPIWCYLGVSDMIQVDRNCVVNYNAETVDGADAAFRMSVQIFDKYKQPIVDDNWHLSMVGGTNNGNGTIGQNTGLIAANIRTGFAIETDVVKYIKVALYTSSEVKLKTATAYLYRPMGASNSNGDNYITSTSHTHRVSGEIIKYKGKVGLTVLDTDVNEFNSCIFYKEDQILTNPTTIAVTLSSVTDLAINDIVGVELNTGDLFWTKISAIVGNTVEFKSALTAIANVGAKIYISRWTLKYGTVTNKSFTAEPNKVVATTINVDGAKIGNNVIVKYLSPLQGGRIWANVESEGVVTVYYQNPTATSITTTTNTLKVIVK